jgi:hypothetical protein
MSLVPSAVTRVVPLLLALAASLPSCGGASSVAGSDGGGAAGVRFAIDSSAARHPISPYVYGSNQVDWGSRSRGLRLTHSGGNRMTAYNWETNASNAGSDYSHQNDSYLGGGETPGQVVRGPAAAAHAAGASIIVTVPIAGYVAADKNGGGDVNQTPDYLNRRFNQSRAAKGRGFANPPDTGDRVVYQDEFVAWLESALPYARGDASRTIFYSLDNEPDLWSQTHPRIRPNGSVTYAELVERTTEYAAAIKAVAPQALVFGPVSYGWQGFVSLQNAPDAGGRDFLDTYPAAMRAAADRLGRRLAAVLGLHRHPAARGGGVRVTENNNNPEVAAARVQAPRSLWDPSYVEQSWISQNAGVGAIRLIPRMREKIAARYPGTKLAITEYEFGGGGHVSGGIAQADVLGIFGREELFAATRWELTGQNAYSDAAFAAFCNYDGAGGRFGDTSVSATTTNVNDTSVYASVDAGQDERVVVVAINKATAATTAEVALQHPVELTRGQAFQLTGSSPALARGPELRPSSRNTFRLELPASSVTTLVLTR